MKSIMMLGILSAMLLQHSPGQETESQSQADAPRPEDMMATTNNLGVQEGEAMSATRPASDNQPDQLLENGAKVTSESLGYETASSSAGLDDNGATAAGDNLLGDEEDTDPEDDEDDE